MKKILFWGIVLIVAALLIFHVMRPRPLEVETQPCSLRSIAAFTVEEGETRLDDVYLVTMPVNGRLLRIELKEGEIVQKDSVIARLETFERLERLKALESSVRETEALIEGVDEAKPKPDDIRAAELAVEETVVRQDVAKKALDAALINYEQEKKQYNRKTELLAEGAISDSEYDEAYRRYSTLKAQYDEAVLNDALAAKLSEQAEVRLKRLRESVDDNEYLRAAYQAQIERIRSDIAIIEDELAKSEILAPAYGPVLEKYQEDERVLPAGTPLLKIGDLDSIGIEADILSEEIGRIQVGQEVEISGPAVGEASVPGKVERIYPSGFQKISSLGIEQQRVKVIVSFDNSSLRLRPGVTVDVKIITDRQENVLTVAERALFKSGGTWHVFVMRDGSAHLTPVELGLRNDEFAEVEQGLNEGDLVILDPPAELTAAAAVTAVADELGSR